MAAIVTTDLTNNTDTGSFDVLMASLETRLSNLVSKGHISTKEYADIYMTALPAVLQQAMQFTLQRQINDKQADLLTEQVATQQQQTLVATEQVLQAKQEVLKATNEVALLAQKTLTEIEQTTLIDAQGTLAANQNSLVTQQIAESQSKVTVNASQKLLIDENVLKAAEEKNLLKQKTESEYAQVNDLQSDATTIVGGVIGKQKELYEAQKEGFKKDALHKAAKLMQDTWAIERGTNSAVDTVGTGLEDPDKELTINAFLVAAGAKTAPQT